jgi:hypothetical protein
MVPRSIAADDPKSFKKVVADLNRLIALRDGDRRPGVNVSVRPTPAVPRPNGYLP